jgi:hypothetical protein
MAFPGVLYAGGAYTVLYARRRGRKRGCGGITAKGDGNYCGKRINRQFGDEVHIRHKIIIHSRPNATMTLMLAARQRRRQLCNSLSCGYSGYASMPTQIGEHRSQRRVKILDSKVRVRERHDRGYCLRENAQSDD